MKGWAYPLSKTELGKDSRGVKKKDKIKKLTRIKVYRKSRSEATKS